MEEHEGKTKKHKLVKNTQSGRTQVGITLSTGQTQPGGRATGTENDGLTLHGNKQHDSCHRRSRLKNSPTQHREEAFQCSVEQRNEQNEVDRNRCDDWNDRAEKWVQNEMTDGYEIELTDSHKSWNDRIWDKNLETKFRTKVGTNGLGNQVDGSQHRVSWPSCGSQIRRRGADKSRLESTRQRAEPWCRQGIQQHEGTDVTGTLKL